ncbi:hypothetical protein BCV70DRAFT_154570 [Testicularia cyperi]|uniref:ribonuclease Z n=1 Tax=Testicularia cyperi TaxID=1882483 RepID=A0A317Y2E5_9BASI|nr:hypothetical protein BCV70DRAFT_154570 [Testicularia cyperi]
MLADLRILHVPSSDTNVLPAVVLQVGADRYLFNVGEGTSRSATQRKANLSRISAIFVPRVGWEAIGGLPGVLMSMADGQRAQQTLYGPHGLRYALATMRTYAKRDIMKLSINEIDTAPTTADEPVYQDSNLSIRAVTLTPTSSEERSAKKLKSSPNGSPADRVDAKTLHKVDQMWRRPNFNPTALGGAEADAWIQLVSDSIFNDTLRQKRAQAASADKVVDASAAETTADMDVEPEEPAPVANSSQVGRGSTRAWRAPLSPAFVPRKLPASLTIADRIHRTEDIADPAEGGQSPVLAFICEAHPQRGKFDPARATAEGVTPGPAFAALTRGEDVAFARPRSWHSMPAGERKKWIQCRRDATRPNHKPKPNANANANANANTNANATKEEAPAAWNDTEDIVVRSADVMGPSRMGAVVVHMYLPSVDYIESLVGSAEATAAFQPYLESSNAGKQRDQSRTPHVILHSAPSEVLCDPRYQRWMHAFGPECHHILANRDVCANKLMFPSSATIPLRLSRLDPVMFRVPQYQLLPRQPIERLFPADANSSLRTTPAEADQLVQLHPRGVPTRHVSGAPDFDWLPDSEEAQRFAAFDHQPLLQESPEQTKQLAKAKAKNAKSTARPNQAESGQTDSEEPVRQVRLQEARKLAWSEFLDVVEEIKAASAASAPTDTGAGADPSAGMAAAVDPKDDLLVTTLGTGSAAPSKYRNVISTLIQTPRSGNILLDAGESTYGLLRRKFGCRRDGDGDGDADPSGALRGQDVDEILRELRVLFISHIHADHHIGLVRILLERRRLRRGCRQPLYLVATSFVHTYLQEYQTLEKLGLDDGDVILLNNEELDYRTGVDPLPLPKGAAAAAAAKADGSSSPSSPYVQKIRADHAKHVEAVKQLMGLEHLHTARVVHRGSHCYGLVVRHRDGWSLTYSGDTRPAPELVAAGRGCSLLIHEATLEDSQLDMAIAKGHSTFGEAIRVGGLMGARNILLTHFSQRYPKMARSSLFAASSAGQAQQQSPNGGTTDKRGKETPTTAPTPKPTPIALAFDMVTYPLSQFAKVQSYTPAMEALFAADVDPDDDADSCLVPPHQASAPVLKNVPSSASSKAPHSVAQTRTTNDAGTSNQGNASCSLYCGGFDDSVGAVASQTFSSVADGGQQGRQGVPTRLRKTMKPTAWGYVGIIISVSPSLSLAAGGAARVTISDVWMATVITSAQTMALGLVDGAFGFDILSLKPDGGEGCWRCILRTPADRASHLVSALAILPPPTTEAVGSGDKVRLRLTTVGPATSIQTLQTLLR